MGITFFVLFVVLVMAGVIVLLLKEYLKSSASHQDYIKVLDELRELDRKNKIEQRRVEVFRQNYMVELEQARCRKERRDNLSVLVGGRHAGDLL